MINTTQVYKYCNNDITQIENYSQAMNDTTQTWECHHRFETDLNLTKQELIDKNLYYNRPANELIFLTKSEHTILHMSGKPMSEEIKRKISKSLKGRASWNKDIHMSEEAKKKISEAFKGRIYINNGVKTKSIKQDELDYYISLGYTKGRLKRN